jgi:hypothetical protein
LINKAGDVDECYFLIDNHLEVRNAAHRLDNCLKGIITGALPERFYFFHKRIKK